MKIICGWLSDKSPFAFRLKRGAVARTLETSPPPPPGFRIHPWRWHHLSIESTLARLSDFSSARTNLLCGTTINPNCSGAASSRARADLVSAFSFLLDANWAIHDFIESSFLVPLVQNHVLKQSSLSQLSASSYSFPSLRSSILALSTSRDRLKQRRESLRLRLARWSDTAFTPNSHHCHAELSLLIREMRELRTDASVVFATAERALVPPVATLVRRADQERFNMRVVRSLDGGRARLALIWFEELLGPRRKSLKSQAHHRNVTDEDRKNFLATIPRHLRLLVPVWRRRMAAKYVRFLDPEYDPSGCDQ